MNRVGEFEKVSYEQFYEAMSELIDMSIKTNLSKHPMTHWRSHSVRLEGLLDMTSKHHSALSCTLEKH